MSDNQLSVWVADFPKEVLILLKFIRKLLKHLSRMLISSQKAFVNCIKQESCILDRDGNTLPLIKFIIIKADITWGLTICPAWSDVTGLALKQILGAFCHCPLLPLHSGSDHAGGYKMLMEWVNRSSSHHSSVFCMMWDTLSCPADHRDGNKWVSESRNHPLYPQYNGVQVGAIWKDMTYLDFLVQYCQLSPLPARWQGA